MIVFLQDFNYLLDIENESVYNIGIVNKREEIIICLDNHYQKLS